MPKKFNIFLITLLLISSFLWAGSKISAAGEYRIIIDDAMDLLSDEEEKMLTIPMSAIADYGNVAFVSCSQYGSTADYAKEVYRQYFGRDSGFLFMIDMGRRNIWIFSDGAIYRTINKAYANTITDNVYYSATKGEYYQCAADAYDQALTLLKGGKIAQPMKYISNALIAFVLALLINFFLLTAQRANEISAPKTLATAMTTAAGVAVISKHMTKQKKSVHVEASSGGGGGSSGGGGGGGGGGGSSGGGGGHSF